MLACHELKKGPGIPLVFLHGFLGTGRDWETVTSHLPDCQCIAVDLPGHGASPFTEQFEIEIPYFHLIGYSMGGRLALQYAFQHPKKIASLTLASTHPGLKSEEEKKKRLAHDRKWADLLLKGPIDEFLTQWYDQPLFYSLKPDWSMRRKQTIPDLAASFLHYSLGHQPYIDPKDALILVGEWDEKFQALYENPTVIPRASHAVHLENPKAVAEAIKRRIFP